MPLYGRAPLQVTFTDTSTPSGEATYWHWDFGDGDTSEAQNPVHMYNSVGDYTVTLSIASAKGIDTFTDVVHATGLLAHWRLEEASGSRADAVGDYDVDEVGGAIASAAGPVGDAVSIVAADGKYLQRASGPVLLDFGGGMTVTAWIHIPAGAPVNAVWFFNGSAFSGNVQLTTAGAGNSWAFVGIANELGETQSAGVDLGALDTWFFVAGRYDQATKKCSFSVDAGAWTLTGNAALTKDPNVEVGQILIGYPAPFCPTVYIDDLRAYNCSLTDDEIAALYALGSP